MLTPAYFGTGETEVDWYANGDAIAAQPGANLEGDGYSTVRAANDPADLRVAYSVGSSFQYGDGND